MNIKLSALSGSLRRDSVNTALLNAFAEAAPKGVAVTLHNYDAVPLFNGDIDGVPHSVEELKAAIAGSDGLIISVPEYNYSVPGVLKNAIDWASRPAYQSVFAGKPTAVLSASPSFTGGVRAQQHLKTILLGMGAPVFPYPEFVVGSAFGKFTDGKLTDSETRDVLGQFAAAFADWVDASRR